jgi:hypothetical protein
MFVSGLERSDRNLLIEIKRQARPRGELLASGAESFTTSMFVSGLERSDRNLLINKAASCLLQEQKALPHQCS